ncbi:MAG TPA: hypothetical protein PK078_08175 [Anaerolineales bacterium]|nr:hypothetical protein [Anaerolineales bacterium]HNA89540.1 hypothetical protein [Anaerolineales bacterium]HNB37618.1 hypothetical protein [Anaerolineales bacterium]HNC08370.1 hypothetical protein [Anaerolineales bacterium]
MENKSPIIRLLTALWLVSSQITGAALMFAPVVVLLTFNSTVNDGSLSVLVGLGYVLPLFFIGLGIAAWIMFARRKDAAAGWLGLATLLPGGLMLFAMNLVAP